ncbi:DUF962 domain-containing protein [Synechococcus sp. Cruz-9H2]|uniref:Mpo1-like protein n=1 Tax=unclassified Synechococcus TaxID=2626047 RepID=UPI0020CD8F95|nr:MULTISPECIES: Mpo1-like protein [unclassified Synechococcus]MCP9818938.1 DUF962 domain-containing protein [Synechococcus sp. Cruz-9H2]MCP9843442.1 DUF962 domain-containing protein [Synechococcus sp. Edmonson 11F2]MCP9855176.1 DUF962 domain-containing protein [Synechococcus sp. Cruz-9C9]MCP9862852.1 DUF962 domain-containing protein [Synechococcus sp. Cruz-7E5]MCP9869848.1 DUF962 domain-containing protein [Synechococcus sp. Cruz-7B9]
MLNGQPWSEWIKRYERSHRHPLNRFCHLIGIPLIVISLVAAALAIWWPGLGFPAAALFLAGWALQFAGHAVEGTLPEFLGDPRFLLVGVRWWLQAIRGN